MMESDRGIYMKGEGSDGACFSLKRKERVLSSSGAEGQEKRVKLWCAEGVGSKMHGLRLLAMWNCYKEED